MRISSASLLVLGLIAGLSGGPVAAQQGMRGPGAAIGGFHLITMPGIQRELQLDESQVARAKEVASRMNGRYQQDMGKLKGLNQDEQMKRVVTLAGPHYEEGMRQLRSFLKPAQLDRFDQILFQQRGPMAMLEPKIAQALQITNEQATQVAQLVAQAQTNQQAAIKEEGGKTKGAAIKVEAIAAEANEKAYDILTPEQRPTWAKIVGPPFRPDLGNDAPAGGANSASEASTPPIRKP